MLLKSLLKGKHLGHILFPQVREEISKNQAKRTREFKWDEKIHPSSGLTFEMCPHDHIRKMVEAKEFPLSTIYKMEHGTVIHEWIQNKLKWRKDCLWEKPILARELIPKLESIWPEVPIEDNETGFSGKIDCILKYKDEPVLVDIKTTSVDPKMSQRDLFTYVDEHLLPAIGVSISKKSLSEIVDKYKALKQASTIDGWVTYCEKELPKPTHKGQVCVYAYLVNRLKYYTKPIRKIGIAYLNLTRFGEISGEKEFYYDFDKELEEKTGLLIHHLALERRAFLDRRDTECSYPLCRQHKGGKD